MEARNAQRLLTQFNNLYKELDDIYHSLARHYRLSDSAFWILYTVKETGEPCYTQSRLCELLSMSKQTINSALKNLEASGHIRLAPVAGNQKNKQIQFTPAGERLAGQIAGEVMQMELKTFEQFSPEEQRIFFRLLGAYVRRLGEHTQAILERPFVEDQNEHHNH